MSLVPLERSIGELPLQMKWEQTLEYAEGPLLCEFSHEKSRFLRLWVDREDGVDRWMFARVKQTRILRYLFGAEDLRGIFRGSSDGYVFFEDRCKGETVNAWVVPADRIHSSYLPDPGVMHDDELRPKCAAAQTSTFRYVLLEGDWSIPKVGKLDRYIKTIAAVMHAFSDAQMMPQPLKDAFSHYSFDKGGWPSGKMFDALLKRLPSAPESDALSFASPGIVRYKMTDSVARDIQHAVERFLANEPALQQAFKSLHDSHRLIRAIRKSLREGSEDFGHSDLQLQLRRLRSGTNSLLRLLPVDAAAVWASVGEKDEKAARVSESLYRRLRALALFQKFGQARLA